MIYLFVQYCGKNKVGTLIDPSNTEKGDIRWREREKIKKIAERVLKLP